MQTRYYIFQKKNVKNKDKYQNCSNLNTNRKKRNNQIPIWSFWKNNQSGNKYHLKVRERWFENGQAVVISAVN